METRADLSSLEEAPPTPAPDSGEGLCRWLAAFCSGLANLFGDVEWDWTMWRGE